MVDAAGVVGQDYYVFENLVLVWTAHSMAPRSIEYDGVTYYRFMDQFFVRCEHLDELELADVLALCRAREAHGSSIGPANENVKKLFRKLVTSVEPGHLVEIGAGARPLYHESCLDFSYSTLDADVSLVTDGASGLARFCSDFPSTGLEDQSIDMVVAVFVFQFRVYPNQLQEIARILSPQGVMVVNVYRRTQDSRRTLVEQLLSFGLRVQIVPDVHEICQAHEYWIVGKDLTRSQLVAAELARLMQLDP